MLLETACKQPDAQPKQAEITPILPMEPSEPAVTQRAYPQIHQPQVRQARGDQQARQPLRVTQMAAVELEAAAFLVRKERFDMCPFPIGC